MPHAAFHDDDPTPTTTNPNPAALLFRFNSTPGPRSVSYAGHDYTHHDGNGEGYNGEAMEIRTDPRSEAHGEDGPEFTDVRRAKSLKVSGAHGGINTGRYLDARRDVAGLSSFAAAGSTLTSPAMSAASGYNPPAAARHPFFSHHRSPSSSLSNPSNPTSPMSPIAIPLADSDTIASTSNPPSPSASVGSSAFSPASAFLSHFSSSTSLRPAPVDLAPDAAGLQVRDYTLGKLLGRGGFSAVRLATHNKTKEVFACKIVKRDDLSDMSGSVERFEEEIKLWSSLPRHPSLLPLLEMHRTTPATYLFMPFLPGGSLLDVLRREKGSEETARKWFPGVVAAVAAMHEGFDGFEGHMLHGDLKLDNFLVGQQGQVMAGDFYMAQRLSPNAKNGASTPTILHSLMPHLGSNGKGPRKSSPFPHSKTLPPQTSDMHPAPLLPSASLPYAPPELLRAPAPPPGLPQDIWATGIVLHALLTGRLPFTDAFDPRLQMKILKGTYEEPTWVGGEWLRCLRGCLNVNPAARWTIQQLKESDAIVGWQEVKSRSKSRSRSRVRRRPSLDVLDTRMRRSYGDGPDSAPARPGSARRQTSQDPRPAPTSAEGPRGRTMTGSRGPQYAPPSAYQDIAASASSSRGRGRSASTSVSRRDSAEDVFALDFSPDIPLHDRDPLIHAVENLAPFRGRSTVKRTDLLSPSNAHFDSGLGMDFIRQSSPMAIDPVPRAYSRSRSTGRQQGKSPSQPAFHSNSPYRHASSSTESRSPPGSSSRSRGGSSPTASKSRSRSRASPAWSEQDRDASWASAVARGQAHGLGLGYSHGGPSQNPTGHSTPMRWEYGAELEVVKEDEIAAERRNSVAQGGAGAGAGVGVEEGGRDVGALAGWGTGTGMDDGRRSRSRVRKGG